MTLLEAFALMGAVCVAWIALNYISVTVRWKWWTK